MTDPESERSPWTIGAPDGALGWSAEAGYVYTAEGLTEVAGRDALVLRVERYEPGDDAMITRVGGFAPLYALVRVDTDVAELRTQVEELAGAVEVAQGDADDVRTKMMTVGEELAHLMSLATHNSDSA